MTVGQYLKESTQYLKDNGILTARLDCLVLLEEILNLDRAKLLVDIDLLISPDQKNVLDDLMAKRAKHIPIAQLTNKAEFYGRTFSINSSVLVPRPESETMIDDLIELIKDDKNLNKRHTTNHHKHDSHKPGEADLPIRILDVGTGSGALGITAKLELQNVGVELSDISNKALEVAKNNVVLHTIGISVIKSDLLEDITSDYDILLANLPYVPDDYNINQAAAHEPKIAIFGGKDGLDLYRQLFSSTLKIHHRPLYILIEALPESHKSLEAIANSSGYIIKKKNDFILTLVDDRYSTKT
jgi:release factor glutamine methyltransferase